MKWSVATHSIEYNNRNEEKWRKPKTVPTFSEETHRHSNSVASLYYAWVNQAIMYVTKYKWKTPMNMLSYSNTPKTQQVERFTHTKITSDISYHHRPGWYFCARENFAYLIIWSNDFSYLKQICPLSMIWIYIIYIVTT